MDEDIKLLVATPCGRGQVEAGYTHSCLQLQSNFLAKQWEISFSFISGCLIHRLRNEFVFHFLNSEYTHILFVDSDIQFDPEVVTRMLSLNKEVIGGICPYKKYIKGQLSYNVVPKSEAVELATHNEAQALEVEKIGTGFLLMKREVFELIKPHATKVIYNSSSEEGGEKNVTPLSMFSFFDFPIDEDGVEHGEDFSFCEKLNKAGVKIWAMHPQYDRFIHWGLHAYGGQ